MDLGVGGYQIYVKAVNSIGGAIAINDVRTGVGSVFIIAGQSNASGIINELTSING